jgi:hypothetical protein
MTRVGPAAGALALLASGQALAGMGDSERSAHLSAPRPMILENLGDIAPALGKCWTPPEIEGVGEITVMLSLRRDGSIIGAPHISYSRAVSPETKRQLQESLLGALAVCGPLPVSPSLGAAIAGRVFAIRFFVVNQKGAHDI